MRFTENDEPENDSYSQWIKLVVLVFDILTVQCLTYHQTARVVQTWMIMNRPKPDRNPIGQKLNSAFHQK